MDNNQIEKLKKQWEAKRKRDACCPNCGHCPTCGRSNAPQFVPVYPVPTWPRYPYYWGTAPTFDHLYRPGTTNATNTVAYAILTHNDRRQ